jgi:hypothetical protein
MNLLADLKDFLRDHRPHCALLAVWLWSVIERLAHRKAGSVTMWRQGAAAKLDRLRA